MATMFTPCTVRPQAADKINRDNLVTAFGLKEQGKDGEIFHMLDPDKGWVAAKDAARVMDADIVSCLLEVRYVLNNEMKVFTSHDDIDFPRLTEKKSSARPISRDDFTKFEITERVHRKFKSVKEITFMGWSIKDSFEIFQAAPRGTSIEKMQTFAMSLEADIIYCRARALYTITGLARIEELNSDLRR